MFTHVSRPVTRSLAVAGAAAVVAGSALVATAAGEDRDRSTEPVRPLGDGPRFDTVFASPSGIEGLTGDGEGNLYSAGRGGDPCPVWRVPSSGGPADVVGNLPAPCSPAGLAFDAAGRLFVGDGGEILTLRPDAANPPTATVFATGVPGSNGLAFDRRGNLWVSDGGTGQGRVWRITPGGAVSEVFRVQPMANDVNLVNGVGGVGRDPRGLPPGTVTITPDGRSAANTAGSQHLVANGLAFAADGTLFVADTARGAVWKVEFDRGGALRTPVGCDTTFPADTLCLDAVFAAHPYLDGVDGIALDRAGNIWAAANERNAVVVVSPERRVVEVFRNAADPATRLRNGGPMEFPTSPFLVGRTLCLTHSDGGRRDNFRNTAGEAAPGQPVQAKISCLEGQVPAAGLPLPVR